MKKGKINTKSNSTLWKIVIFALVLLLVVGAILYSIILRDTDTVIAGSSSNKISNGANVGSNVPTSLDISDLNWVKNLNSTIAQYDVVFISVPGNNTDINKKAENEISSASAKIKSQGVNISNISIDEQNPEYSVTVSRMSSIQLPAVFAVNKNGNGLVIFGDITETKLLQAFLTLAKACAPGASSGCCP